MINKNNIYFSFDDGYPKDLEFAKELKRRGFNNLTFYVPIKNIEGKECLTSDQIRELSKLGEIGGHTFNHVDLMTIPLGKVEDEVKKGKEELEKITGKKINSFCYPRGHFNKKIEENVKKCGFTHSRSARLFNFHKMNPQDFVEHPNIHFYPHSRLIDILHCIKNLDFYSIFWRFRYIYLNHYEMIYKILEKNGCVHIWGHTWEIDESEFEKMVDVLNKKLKNMKIAHISDYFTLKLGYQEAFLAKEEVKNGDEVYILTSNRNYPFPNYEETYKNILGNRELKSGEFKEEGIIIRRLKSIFEIPSSALVVFMGILKNLRKIKPDVIVCHDLIKPNNIRAYFYKFFFNKSVKIIIDTHEAEYNTSIDSILKKLYIALRKIFYRPIITKYSDKIVATGPNEKAFTLKYFLSKKTKIEIIPLGADTELFKPNKDIRDKMRRQYNIKENEIVFINAGKINESKKNKELLEAFVQLYKSYKNIRLFFVGNGDQEYIDEMKKIVVDNKFQNLVTFIPFVKNEKLPKYFNMSDVGVWPGSRSNVFWEAAACGLPLILEDGEGPREFVYEGENGYLLRTITKDSVYKSLDKILKMNIKKMGLKSREIIEKEFSWKIINKKLLDFN